MTRPLAEIEAELRRLGCMDGGCSVLHPKGMHTNGGCRCVRDMLATENPRMRVEQVLRLKDERADAMREDAAPGYAAMLRAVRSLLGALTAKRMNDGDRMCVTEAEAVLRGR